MMPGVVTCACGLEFLLPRNTDPLVSAPYAGHCPNCRAWITDGAPAREPIYREVPRWYIIGDDHYPDRRVTVEEMDRLIRLGIPSSSFYADMVETDEIIGWYDPRTGEEVARYAQPRARL